MTSPQVLNTKRQQFEALLNAGENDKYKSYQEDDEKVMDLLLEGKEVNVILGQPQSVEFQQKQQYLLGEIEIFGRIKTAGLQGWDSVNKVSFDAQPGVREVTKATVQVYNGEIRLTVWA